MEQENQAAKSMKSIMVIGSTCVDIVIRLDHLPRTAEDIHPSGQSMALGGCAFNVASMIRLFGAPVTLVSPVGTGLYGEYVEKELTRLGFDIRIRVKDQENGCCYCLVEAGGERTFLSCHGAEYIFHKDWMARFASERCDMVYVCGLEIEEPTGAELIEYLGLHPERELFYAPGPRGIHISPERTRQLFALHPVLHLNEQEAKELSGASFIPEAAGRLRSQTGNTVLITLGARGTCCLEQSGRFYTVEGVPARVADTIGAGDAHIGAVMACLSAGIPLSQAVRIANRAAAKVVSVEGATLTRKEFGELRGAL